MVKRQKRQEGALQPLKGDRLPKAFICFDTETSVPLKTNDIREFRLKLGVAIYIKLNDDLSIKQKVVYRFKSAQEFVEILQYHNRQKQLLYVFAHNIGFDVRVLDLPELFNSLGFTSEPPIINQMAFIWRVKSAKGNYLFLDTANLGVHSVASLGNDIGIQKLSIELDTNDEDSLYAYCERDTDILVIFVCEYLKYIDLNGLGSFKVTLASQSLTAFRTRFMTTAPHIHNHLSAINLERKAYHGGRVECFRIGEQSKQNWYYLDVNSMYPYAMCGDDLPIMFLGYSENPRMKEFKLRMSRYYVIADVLLDTDENLYPIIQDNKLIFPIGRFRAALNHPELEYALDHGHIKRVYASSQYAKGSLFDSYVNFFYEEKRLHTLSGNKTQKTIAKRYLNSLYGKFGQSEPHRESYDKTDFKGVMRETSFDKESDLHMQFIYWYGEIFKEYKQGETSFSCPYLASAVTAKARMLLWLYIKQAGKENVVYCDTDSLIVNSRGYRNLLPNISQDRLGSLKIEAQSKHFELYGAKDYIFDDNVRHKGIPSKAEKISKDAWEYLEFEGFIRWMNRGAKGAPKGQFKTKTRRTTYNKGVINENNSISPYTLDSGERFDIVGL